MYLMETTGIATDSSSGRLGSALTPLGRLTVATLLVAGLVYLALMLGSGAFDLFGPHVAVVVVVAIVLAAGWRWTPGLAAFVMAALFVETVMFARQEPDQPR